MLGFTYLLTAYQENAKSLSRHLPLPLGCPLHLATGPQLSIAVASIDTTSTSAVSAASAYALGQLEQATSVGSIDGAAQVMSRARDRIVHE